MPENRQKTARSNPGASLPDPQIAVQAGLSERTVDRVLNNRGQVRESTVREVHQAIADLDRQRSQLRLSGRTFVIDVAMQAPQRFSSAVRDALEAGCPRCDRPRCRPVFTSVKPVRSRTRWQCSTAFSHAAHTGSS